MFTLRSSLSLTFSLCFLLRSKVARAPASPTYMAAERPPEHGSDWLSEVTPPLEYETLLPASSQSSPPYLPKTWSDRSKWPTHTVRRHAYIP